MRRPLGLHQLTAMDLDPLEFVRVAAACGYDHVSLFTNRPRVPLEGHESTFVFPTVTREMTDELKPLLADSGLDVVNAEFFLMRPDIDLESYIPGLAMGREIGAVNAVTHVFDEDSARAVDILGAFCELAAAQDMRVAIEFCQMTPGCKTIGQAKWFVDQVGKANLGFGICPMHLTRSGDTAADMQALDGRYLFFGQVNDGNGLHVSAAYFDEVHDRELPGDGDFPLHDILSALPASAPIEVKLPSDRRRKAGVSALDFAREAGRRSRALVDGLKPGR
jgi:sugar phosphate isomerase/epimerase